MEGLGNDIYIKMLRDIGWFSDDISDRKGWIENCFNVSFLACASLQKIADSQLFTSWQERKWFFRTLRPQFEAFREYLILLYRAELFGPEDLNERMKYWNSELKRNRDFLVAHEIFYRYYRHGRTEQHTAYFGGDIAYGRLVAKIIARERYLEYVQSEIAHLLQNNNEGYSM